MKKDVFNGISLEQLVKYLEGTVSDEEKELVEKWLQGHPDNPVYLKKIREAWEDLIHTEHLTEQTIQQDWARVLKRIHLKDPSRQIHWYRSKWAGIAAILILGMFLAGVLLIGTEKFKQKQNQVVVYNELVVPKGQKSQLVLSDGSRIWVNAGSKLKFPNRFEGNSREVWLDGEAFFEIKRNEKKPFYVYTSDIKIKVLGTVFNVKAYSTDDYIETTLVSGSVSLEKKNSVPGEKAILLKPNHKAIYLKSESSLVENEVKKHVFEPLKAKKILISEPVSTEQVTSWKDGKLVFEDETLENVAKKLEMRYDVEIKILDETIKNYRYTGILKNISIEQAMRALQLTTAFKYHIKDSTIIIESRK